MGKRATIPASGVCAASIDFDSALAILAAHARPLGKESVSLADAGGRYLAAPVVARIDASRRDCAAMDGYAVRDADLKSGITLLRSRGASYAGSAEPGAISAGETWRVMTGDRKRVVWGKRVSVRVELGCGRVIKKKKKQRKQE